MRIEMTLLRKCFLLEANGKKYPKRECQIQNYTRKSFTAFHIPYIDKILIQKQWNDFVFYNNI